MTDLPDVVTRYLAAFNARDVEGMLAALSDNIRFRNIENDDVNVDIIGLMAFEHLARESAAAFRTRSLTPSGVIIAGPHIAFNAHFVGVLDRAAGEALKAGQNIEMDGQSYIRVEHDFITEITDSRQSRLLPPPRRAILTIG